MGDAQRGDDSIAFFAATLGRTSALSVTDAGEQISDADGPLAPGRYLLHVANVSAPTVVIWVATGAFESGGSIAVTTTVPFFPMSPATILAIELNIVKGHNDRIAAIATAGGTGTLYITQISRGA